MPSISRKKRFLKNDRHNERKSRKMRGGNVLTDIANKIMSLFGKSANDLESAANEFKKIKSDIQTKVKELNNLFDKVMPSIEKCQSSMDKASDKMNEMAPMAAAPLPAALPDAAPPRIDGLAEGLGAERQNPDALPRQELPRQELPRQELPRDEEYPNTIGGKKEKSKRKTKRKTKRKSK